MISNKLFKTAFTLIELLVVIAIIGILSGLIIVGMSSSTNSARIAKSQIFSASLKDSLLMNLISEWRFEGSGSQTSISDSWGTNNGSLANFTFDTTDGWRSGSQCVYSSCLQFDGTNDYVSLGTGSNLDFTGPFTISFWMKALSQNGGLIAKWTWGGVERGYNIFMGNGNLNFNVGHGDNTYTVATAYMLINEYTYVSLVYDGSYLKIYKDGAVTGTPVSVTKAVTGAAGNSFYVGRPDWDVYYFNGFMDDIRVFNAAIPTSQIKDQYYSGLKRLFENGGIAKEDYRKRIIELAIHE